FLLNSQIGSPIGDGVVLLLVSRPEVPQRFSEQEGDAARLLESHRQGAQRPIGLRRHRHETHPRLPHRPRPQRRAHRVDHARVLHVLRRRPCNRILFNLLSFIPSPTCSFVALRFLCFIQILD
ncbi:unnamed protein product, partial [Linum tenue]